MTARPYLTDTDRALLADMIERVGLGVVMSALAECHDRHNPLNAKVVRRDAVPAFDRDRTVVITPDYPPPLYTPEPAQTPRGAPPSPRCYGGGHGQ